MGVFMCACVCALYYVVTENALSIQAIRLPSARNLRWRGKEKKGN